MSVFIHETAVVDEGCRLGDGTKVWHFSHLMSNTTVGAQCNIGQNVFIASNVKLGDNNKIQNNVSIYEGVETEDDVFIGPSAVFTNVINPRSAVSRRHEYQKTHIEKGATIGANATIICGNRIGQYAFIAAGAVVTKDVSDYSLVQGNPAKPVGFMSRNGQKLHFDENNQARCPESGETYLLQNGRCVYQQKA